MKAASLLSVFALAKPSSSSYCTYFLAHYIEPNLKPHFVILTRETSCSQNF